VPVTHFLKTRVPVKPAMLAKQPLRWRNLLPNSYSLAFAINLYATLRAGAGSDVS
jgi:hypothetical protein